MKTWNELFDSEKEKPYFRNLESFVHTERLTKTIFPNKEDVFSAFDLLPFDKVKVVILGQDPYHDINQAHGLAFSVNDGVKIPPSLRNIFKEMKEDIGSSIPESGNLTKWGKQGVLLLNTILTVEAHKPLSHKGIGWEQFTDKVIFELNKDSTPKVFVLWGNNAQKKAYLITNRNHLIIQSSHPSPLSARHSFFGSRVFTKINQFLKSSQLQEIDFTL